MRAEETLVAFESPRRVGASLAVLAELDPERPVAVCRELTKIHEEVVRGTAAELAARYADTPPRGEVVLVIGGAAAGPGTLAAGGRRADAAGRGRRRARAGGGGRRRADGHQRQRAVRGADRGEVAQILHRASRDRRTPDARRAHHRSGAPPAHRPRRRRRARAPLGRGAPPPWRGRCAAPSAARSASTPAAPYAAGQRRGIDVAAPPGTTVRAACPGRVRFAGASRGRARRHTWLRGAARDLPAPGSLRVRAGRDRRRAALGPSARPAGCASARAARAAASATSTR